MGILGSTYTGEFEDIKGLDKAIEELNKKKGWTIGIHVDGASGAFVAPFTDPDLAWDFRLKNVVSINASGHKCVAPHGLQSIVQCRHAGLAGLAAHPASMRRLGRL